MNTSSLIKTAAGWLVLMMALLGTVSCQNNGHIGNLFGTWALREMSVNGAAAADFDPETTTWNFQNDIIRICLDLGHNSAERRTGTWERKTENGKSYLLLNYTHHEGATEPGTGQYRAPEWLGFPENEVIELRFVEDKSRSMVLTWTDAEGNVYTYTLKKTW